MTLGSRLVCLAPATPATFAIEDMPVPQPGKGEVLVRVIGSSVNPIDVKRSGGYGQRLLRLKGAGTFPLVLGNDVVGEVDAVGQGVTRWRSGDRVMGLVPTGKGGAHASHVVADQRWLRAAPISRSSAELAVFPYTFTTLWQTFRKAGVFERNAPGLNVLVHGASGALGQLATQLLVRWGASVTAICSTSKIDLCRSLGATSIWDRLVQPLNQLPACYDVVLNFGAWEDEEALLGGLKSAAIGAATTVHPLLSNFDRNGWVGGAWRTILDMREHAAKAAAKGARYGWVVFNPEEEALDVLVGLLVEKHLALPVGITTPLCGASAAFKHVAQQRPGRAVLLP